MSNLIKACKTGLHSRLCVILGSQWGDEGKGKLVDILAEHYDYVARFNGGANAGHTIVVNKRKYAFHLLPCGILYPQCQNIIGNGCVVRPSSLFQELKQLDDDKVNYKGRLLISDRAHLVTEMHIASDSSAETDPKKRFLGTTKQGIGPTYASKASRTGLRVGDLRDWDSFVNKYKLLHNRFEETEKLNVDPEKELASLKETRERFLSEKMIVDTVALINKILTKTNKRILAEGANATMLDTDFGTYPYVTSSNTWAAGVSTGLGIPPSRLETRIGIVKAYTTRVGEGPFPSEFDKETGEYVRKVGGEYGATTGRPRRCGWLDLNVIRYAHMLNDFSSINITKLDVLDGMKEIKIGYKYQIDGKEIDYMPSTIEELNKVSVVYETLPGWQKSITGITKFEELPENAKRYIQRIEELTGIKVTWIGTGPAREQMILRE